MLDASAIAQVDSTAAAMLAAGIADEFAARGIALGLARSTAKRLGCSNALAVIDWIGATMVFDDLDDALRAFRAAENRHRAIIGIGRRLYKKHKNDKHLSDDVAADSAEEQYRN